MPKTLIAILVAVACVACGSEPAARPAAPPSPTPAGAPGSPGAKPIAVSLELEAKGGSPSPLAREWMKELNAVLVANPQHFVVANDAKDAELKVRIERVDIPKDPPGHQVMTLWLTAGSGEPKRYTLDYTGRPSAMAGRLARFLGSFVEQSRAGAAKASPQ